MPLTHTDTIKTAPSIDRLYALMRCKTYDSLSLGGLCGAAFRFCGSAMHVGALPAASGI